MWMKELTSPFVQRVQIIFIKLLVYTRFGVNIMEMHRLILFFWRFQLYLSKYNHSPIAHSPSCARGLWPRPVQHALPPPPLSLLPNGPFSQSPHFRVNTGVQIKALVMVSVDQGPGVAQ